MSDTNSVNAALARLRDQFAGQLPQKIDDIIAQFRLLQPAAWNADEADKLHRLLHGLTGSAGTFGMQSISNFSRNIELRLADLLKLPAPPAAEWQALATELEQLQKLARIRLDSNAHTLKPPQHINRADSSPLIFLVEDDPLQAEHLKQALQKDGYRVSTFIHIEAFRAACLAGTGERPAAIIMDMIFPEGKDSGAQTLAKIRSHIAHCPPVIFMSVRDDIDARLAAFRAGASRYLEKPLDTAHLLDLLNELTGRLPAQPYRVLMVDDDALLLEAHATVLRAAGMEVLTLDQPLQIMEALNQFNPDVAILDVYMPDASGPELAAILREREQQMHMPILFLSSETNISQQLLALNLGGDDFLVKPVNAEHLIEAVTARARRARQSSAMRRRLETTLYEREREHLALNQHAIVSIADRAGNITYANEKFCEVSGYSEDELLGHNHRLIKSGMHPPEFYRELWRTISSGKVWQGEVCNRRKDGSLYWVESTITPFVENNSDGIPYQYVSIRTDITHVKAAEQAVKRSESRLNFILQASPVVIYTCEAKPGFPATYVSPNIEKLFGYSTAYCLGTPSFWKDGIHPDDAPRIFAGFQHVLDLEAYHHEYRFRMPDGSYRWIHDSLQVVRNEQGAPVEIIGYWADIDDRVRAEQAAEADKERLHRGQQFANIGTWDWNIQSGALYWTERIAPLFGYPVGELDTSYDNFLAAIHPDDRQAVVDAVNACVERDAPYEIEHRVVWPDGTVRWLLERGAVRRDADGNPVQMLGVVQDIDDRKRTELKLIERERQLREAQTMAHIGNWSADIATGQLTWSDEIYRIFGYDPDSFAPSVDAFKAAIHPDDRERVRKSEERAAKTGLHDVVHRIVRPDGSVRHVHELARAETDAGGKLLRLSGTVQDITERILAENKLHETEARFAFAVEGAGDGIWDWDMHSNAMQFSRLYMEMLGYAENELPQHADTWANSVHPEDRARVNEQLQQYLEGKLPTYNIELRLQCKDGSYKWVLCRGTVVSRDSSGKPVRMIGIHSDITERKKIEHELIMASDEANRANQAKSEFLSSMSHELRTPMNAILGFGQLLQYDEHLNAEQQDNVHEILRAGEHLLELINEVLDLSKIESGHIDLSLEPVELCPLLEECLNLIDIMAEKRNIKVSHSGIKGVALRADRTRLKQALLNLLSNAVKYNRDDGSVHIEVRQHGTNRLRIQVQDSGMGISPARLQELFQPFNRLGAESSNIEGTGIGLTITRRIVEMMGGSVDVASETGIGSTFWIELPLESMPAQEHLSDSGRHTTLPAQDDNTTKHTVLYIEDNPSNIRLMALILGRRKHVHLLTAHTPELGLELALARHPDLILLDINMPGMDGYQVLQVIKAEPALNAIPVIAVTANAMPRDIAKGKAAGFAEYLTKPLDIDLLNKIVDKHLVQ